MSDLRKMIEKEVSSRGVSFSGPDEEGLYTLELEAKTLILSVENIIRDVERDGDLQAISRFVDRVLAPDCVVDWAQARSRLFFSTEPACQDFDSVVHWPVTETVAKVLVLTDPREERVTWVNKTMLRNWNVSEEAGASAAATNMDRLIAGIEPEVPRKIDGMSLGMIPVDSVFKASVIFAPGFRQLVSTKIGWPVLVVLPCRDFLYVLAEKDNALLARLGGVVQREFRNSGYPITTEVLRVSENGISAVGRFPE